MSDNLHENENYIVRVSAEGIAYEVMNKITGVIEFDSRNLPECIFASENMNVVITHKTYEWIAKKADDQKREEVKASAQTQGLKLLDS